MKNPRSRGLTLSHGLRIRSSTVSQIPSADVVQADNLKKEENRASSIEKPRRGSLSLFRRKHSDASDAEIPKEGEPAKEEKENSNSRFSFLRFLKRSGGVATDKPKEEKSEEAANIIVVSRFQDLPKDEQDMCKGVDVELLNANLELMTFVLSFLGDNRVMTSEKYQKYLEKKERAKKRRQDRELLKRAPSIPESPQEGQESQNTEEKQEKEQEKEQDQEKDIKEENETNNEKSEPDHHKIENHPEDHQTTDNQNHVGEKETTPPQKSESGVGEGERPKEHENEEHKAAANDNEQNVASPPPPAAGPGEEAEEEEEEDEEQEEHKRATRTADQNNPFSIANLMKIGEHELVQQDPKKILRVIDKSGKGGFGAVFQVKDKKGNLFAMKRMGNVTSKQIRTNFKEIGALKTLIHPNIVSYHSSYCWNDEVIVVMEFMEGGTLTEAVKLHLFNEPQIAYIAREMLKALDFLHSRHLIHRDLKSSNVMMSVNGEIKLIDFGLVSESANGKQRRCGGSPYWMSPEMINLTGYDTKNDIWSFAVCVLELARIYHEGGNFKVMFTVAVQGWKDVFKGNQDKWTNEFQGFIAKCLVHNSDERATAAELLNDPFIGKASEKSSMQNVLTSVFLQNALRVFA